MTVRGRVLQFINTAIAPLGAEVIRKRPSTPSRPWDRIFLGWIDEAARTGKDPNDVGDVDWSTDPLRRALEEHYLPYTSKDSVILELGPGTGRLSRHIISRCKQLILVDYSDVVCAFLQKYLDGKGNFSIYKIDAPSLPQLASSTVDAVFANGVFEHLDPEDTYWFLHEFYRVLMPGGVVVFTFTNIMSEEGIPWLRMFSERPGERCGFRFYHPEMVQRLAEAEGLEVIRITTNETRLAYAELRKPAADLAAAGVASIPCQV